MQKRVIKVGGSLLARGSFADELSSYLQPLRDELSVILVGGGAMVDCLRTWHQTHQADECVSHWLAVDTLDITAQLVAHLLQNSQLINCYTRLVERVSSGDSGVVVFAPSRWLRELRATDPALLPENWRVTSDSISALLARQLELCQLLILKSMTPVSTDIEELARNGVVDELLPDYAAGLVVSIDCPFASAIQRKL